MPKALIALAAALSAVLPASAQTPAEARSQTERMASTVMHAWPAGVITTIKNPGSWSYEEGVLLDGMTAEWRITRDPAEFAYLKASVDKYILPDGTVRLNQKGTPFNAAAHTLDDIEMARAVMAVYQATKEDRYAKAATFLHQRLADQPRTASGGYWHKQIYPNQMWLDGAFMAEPFRAEYAATFHQPADFDDIAKQFLLMDTHMRDPKTGLLRHGWDESRQMPWAEKTTGLSPQVWARAMGWYEMALVDTLDWFPRSHPQHAALVAALKRTIAAVARFQDPATGLWWQVMDRGADKGNYLEASASAMFCYAMAKGVRQGYLPAAPYKADARKAWHGIQTHFVRPAADGSVTLTGTVKVGGLGGSPYRSGTYEYYIGEATGENDSKGVGAYLLAGAEIQQQR
jgi:unsaturated rhamnogalacturonyl hydrolase